MTQSDSSQPPLVETQEGIQYDPGRREPCQGRVRETGAASNPNHQ